MKKYTLVILLLLLVPALVIAQEGRPDRKGKFFLTPEFWLSFGSTTYIEVAPLLGYHVMDRLVLGLGPHYIYQSVKATPYHPNAYDTHVFGMKGFARFFLFTDVEQFLPIDLFSDLFIHLEYEGMSLEKNVYYQAGDQGRFLYHSFLVGGGLNQRIGMYNSISFMVLWDINESTYSPYSNPVFRLGFNTYF